MDSVFVAGSRALSKLNASVKERLDNIIAKQLTVLVGDANGPTRLCNGILQSGITSTCLSTVWMSVAIT